MFTYDKTIERCSVQILSGELMTSCLGELCFCLARHAQTMHLNGASLLSHIQQQKRRDRRVEGHKFFLNFNVHIRIAKYTADLPITVRMMTLSLCNFTLVMREKIQQHPLFSPISQSAHLLLWMMSCSGTDEQYFLNTCDTASYCVSNSFACYSSLFFLFVDT